MELLVLLVFPHTKTDFVCCLQGRTLACGKQAKAECDPRKLVGAAGARDHGSRQRDGSQSRCSSNGTA